MTTAPFPDPNEFIDREPEASFILCSLAWPDVDGRSPIIAIAAPRGAGKSAVLDLVAETVLAVHQACPKRPEFFTRFRWVK